MYTFNLNRAFCVVATVALLCLSQVRAPAQTYSQSTQQANNLLKEQKWADAAQAYEIVVKAEPDNAAAWFGLGSARYQLGQLAPAAAAFEKNIDITKNPVAMFNLACVYARTNEKDKAIEWLRQAFLPEKKAYFILDLNDPDLNSLHDDARFKEISISADRLKNPCMYSAEVRQFDFWVGEWDAYGPQGRKSGSSVIQRISNGCGILENWTNALGGGTGKSINFFDPQAGKWFQYWIGADGNPHRFSGVYKDGALRFEGEPYIQNGKKFITRLTFFNVDPNTFRQLSEQSDDDGKSWSVVYDFKYVRRSAAKEGASKTL
jgi:tetratricopeptide (TPR) repeat protein